MHEKPVLTFGDVIEQRHSTREFAPEMRARDWSGIIAWGDCIKGAPDRSIACSKACFNGAGCVFSWGDLRKCFVGPIFPENMTC